MSTTHADPTAASTLRILEEVTRGFEGNFSVRLWDGSTWEPGTGDTPFMIVLRHPGALRLMLWPFSAVSFGEAYIFDDFDVEGDIFAFTLWIRHLVTQAARRSLWSKLRLLRALTKLPNQKNPRDLSKAGRPSEGDHSLDRDRESIHFAYNIPGAFYRLFLGPTMQYTCAYFKEPDQGLDTAQTNKIDHICRKLRLKPGERLVDFGCGWGGLLMHAVKNYGVEGVGVTLAGEQATWAERAIAEAGLQKRIRIQICDYREFNEPGQFDKACSVGIGEHIGHRNLPVFFGKVFECLKPGGAYLHHGITLRPYTPYPRWTTFARKYVFPNGELHSILDVLTNATRVGFEVRDVESLREHYIKTLEHWVQLLEANHDEALKIVDEVCYRVFRIYLAGATLGFKNCVYNLNHSLLIKPDNGRSGLPLTRADLYA
jgi:cyclopropane-fatty-acyl-phospholipid synthase